ncbi:CRISPR-associated ring nuclease Crn3/Csx3 [Methanosarcina mazei]|jgi:CRISPR-associated protein Csx3|uniref:CRISPR-associated protein Csx3 n=2 Tax=Methanosarcina mazei TaxID=2209 RepID=A0A6C0VHL2_METMZ|nr:CRISPR-associated ring nuclease Crn3/Csx3 [Methanosarcina mazei]AKB67862.1 CRISPR-associated protein, Csx3 family [Methanosarcina mazei LYC]QIB90861.1 CRISPR-associated protein Csx3 [Methanosarcina mazei]
MSNVTFNTTEKDDYTLVSFEIPTVLAPEDLSTIAPPEVNGAKGVILSGRGPIWLYCFLIHFYHPTKFVATYDPRIGGAVIVERHVPDYNVGSIFKC